MKQKQQPYEVDTFTSGNGHFIWGNGIGEVYVKDREDADLICAALNQFITWKTRKTLRKVEVAIAELELLMEELK